MMETDMRYEKKLKCTTILVNKQTFFLGEAFLKKCLIPKWDRHGDGEEGVNAEMNMLVWNIMLVKFILSLIGISFAII